MKLLKSALKFWQEIIFIILLGILVSNIPMNLSTVFQDKINILFYCLFLLLITCLIGQFYWKSLALSFLLAFLLGLGSAWMALAALSDLSKMTGAYKGYYGLMFGMFVFIGLTIIAFTMPLKYIMSDVERIEPKISTEEL